MPPPARGRLAAAFGFVPTALTLCALGGLAWWGHQHDWKLPSLTVRGGDTDEKKKEPEPATRLVPPPDAPASADANVRSLHLTRIEFPNDEAVAKAGIQVAAAREQAVEEVIRANAAVDYDPSTYAQLSVRAVGTVWWVEKHIGQPVRKGEVLALVEAAEVGRAKADFLQSLTQFDVRTKALQRMQVAGASIPERSVIEAQTAVREARIKLFSDQQTLFNLGLSVKIEDVQALPEDQLVRTLRLLGVPPSIVQGRGNPDTLTANLLPLAAPFDGRIVQRNASLGEAASPAKPLFLLADVRRVHIDLAVDPADAGRVHPGQLVTFRAEGSGETYSARVAHISPEVDEKIRKVWVHAEADNPESRLRPHAYGTARIVLAERPKAIVVPADAVQSDGGLSFVFVRLNEATFQARIVQVGVRNGKDVEVCGMQAGEEVVTVGSHALKSELLRDRIGADE